MIYNAVVMSSSLLFRLKLPWKNSAASFKYELYLFHTRTLGTCFRKRCSGSIENTFALRSVTQSVTSLSACGRFVVSLKSMARLSISRHFIFRSKSSSTRCSCSVKSFHRDLMEKMSFCEKHLRSRSNSRIVR